ncbi:MAG TPA: hypothetical protein EYG90_02340 [Campylobacterales bacterium]|nr:hypothetical protein [Campylobacterales bacterium]
MSIIGNFTAQPNRVEMLIYFLKKDKKSYSKSDLEAMFSPQSSSVFREVYGIVESLKVIEIENDIVKLKIENSKQLTEIIKEAIFKDDFIKKDEFALALSWLLIQNTQSLNSLEWSGQVNNMVLKDLNEEFGELDLTNSARWQHFGYWAIYLGFATKISIAGKDYLCPDPTEAIERELKRVFKESKELLIRDFFEYLAKETPVLEFGSVRNRIMGRAREGLQLPDNQLSFSTSLSLLRLENRGLISLEQKSDADSLSLQSDTENSRIISHIVYRGKVK